MNEATKQENEEIKPDEKPEKPYEVSLEEATGISHEDIKTFMNQPDPEPKAPPPMDLDDLAPMEQQDGSLSAGRLTTEQIADLAYCVARHAAVAVDCYWSPDSTIEHWTQWVNFIINCAANPNNAEVCRDIYDIETMRARDNDEFWLPWSQITPQERLPWLIFRQTVIQCLSVWAGH